MSQTKTNGDTECPTCGRVFHSETGLNIHQTKMEGKPWHDPLLIETLYHDEGMNQYEIADFLGVDHFAIYQAMKNFGIETRSSNDYPKRGTAWYREPVPLRRVERGYECWEHKYDNEVSPVLVHRLLAVAEFGFDSVVDKQVHHKNGIPWDNRPDNIQVVTVRDHARIHHGELELGEYEEIASKYIEGQYTISELADEYDAAKTTVLRAIAARIE